MRNTRVTHYEDTPRDVVITGNDYSPHYVLPRHAHKRGQLLYAATGVVTVITDEGSWVVPPRRVMRSPERETHSSAPICGSVTGAPATGVGSSGTSDLLRRRRPEEAGRPDQ